MRFKLLVYAFLFIPTLGSCLALAATTRPSIAANKAHYLKTLGPKRVKLICFRSGRSNVLGLDPKLKSGKVSYVLFRPQISERKISQAALKECKLKLVAPACSDGCDNDGDGLRDYPRDLECSSPSDSAETITANPLPTPTVTPTPAPSIALCSDGIDNDSDGKTDYPNDPGCDSIGDTDETDVDTEPTTPFTVFRKPFDGEFSIGGMFDHRYPLELVHFDGVTITYTNEETTIGVDGHQGYDFTMDEGTPILAAYDGTVNFAGVENPWFCSPLNATVSGKFVRVRHQIQSEQFDSIYGHFSSINVTNGQVVKKGDLLGLSGNTGCSTGPHLHFDIQRRTNTNNGQPSSFDPAGWKSDSPDPWETHPQGTQSFRLWAPGEGPKEFRYFDLAPNPSAGNNAAVAIIHMQWAGMRDDVNPNNEFIEIEIDPRFYPSATYNLAGCTLRNNLNEKFTFPSGFLIKTGEKVRIYSGAGVNSANVLYWGRTSGAWSNKGDCAHLMRPTGVVMYALHYGGSSCASLPLN
jgi:murein DD-endopeptidase MepM/ murein hydrolase activator NlpD